MAKKIDIKAVKSAQVAIESLEKTHGKDVVERAAVRYVNFARAKRKLMKEKKLLASELAAITRKLKPTK